jgi:hypothetical protein
MSLCIAATCSDGDDPKIVMCTDWRAEFPAIGSHENADKLSFIKDGWPVLLAGEGPSEVALVSVYQQDLKSANLKQDNIYDQLKAPMHKRKATLADDFTQQMLGITYRDFLAKGKATFPDEFFRQHVEQVEKIRLGASLIICGFIDTYDYLEKKNERSSVIAVVDDEAPTDKIFSMQTDFAAIGSGYASALGVLCRRGQSSDDSLLRTIYVLYEAKMLSDLVPGVSESALSIDILSADGTMQSLSDEGYDVCEKLFSRFGPRAIEDDNEKHQIKFKMESKYLEPFIKSFSEESEKRKKLASFTAQPTIDSSSGNLPPSSQ